MNKQDKELLLKDLCARLPYGVKVQIKANNCYDGINTLNFDDLNSFVKNCPRDEDWYDVVTSIKPYLRPMPSMTDEEKMYVNELIYDKDGLFLSPIPTWVINECDIDKYIDFCNSKHLDWRGLISKGLALPAPEDMYNF